MIMLEMEKNQDVLDIYLELTDYVSNWDLVDSSAGITGRALVKFIDANTAEGIIFIDTGYGDIVPSEAKINSILESMPEWYKSLFNSKSLWKVRIAIVSLLKVLKEYPKLAANLIITKIEQMDSHYTLELNGTPFDDLDLIYKAIGWILREIGKVDKNLLLQILTSHSSQMAKITVSYAVERLSKPLQTKFKNIKK